jgi:hypothetical protein
MPKKPSPVIESEIRVPKPLRYDAFLDKLGTKDRQNFERQVAASEAAGPGLGERWKKLTCLLMALAPHPPRLDGTHTIQFFIPDGKYRKQVFALHAMEEGAIAVCFPDILKQALSSGILAKSKNAPGSNAYSLPDSKETLNLVFKDGTESDPESYYKAMTGWNRKAICIILPARTGNTLMDAAARLCALAAKDWIPTEE